MALPHAKIRLVIRSIIIAAFAVSIFFKLREILTNGGTKYINGSPFEEDPEIEEPVDTEN